MPVSFVLILHLSNSIILAIVAILVFTVWLHCKSIDFFSGTVYCLSLSFSKSTLNDDSFEIIIYLTHETK